MSMPKMDEDSIARTALGAWIKARGEGATARLARDAGMTWPSVAEIVKGRSTPRVETARALSRATGGEVTVAEILGLCDNDFRRSIVQATEAAE